ncbi:MAG: RDD family protein [Opitutaceae bacterium]
MAWYYAVSNQRLGPVSEEEFGALVINGTITPSTLVWRQGMNDWLPYAQTTAGGAAPDDPDSAVCAVSGKRYPKSQMLQYEGRWVSAEHRDVFFQRLREGLNPAAADTMPGPYGYAGFWIRFVARIIDGLAVGFVNMLIVFPMAFLFGMYTASNRGTTPNLALVIGFQVVTNLLSFAMAIGYELWMIRKYDATLGKMALGLKLLRADGAKLGKGRIVGRYFAHFVSGITLLIGYMMAGWDDEKRALHDRICDTRVIRTR